jgi:hypothetical protein
MRQMPKTIVALLPGLCRADPTIKAADQTWRAVAFPVDDPR